MIEVIFNDMYFTENQCKKIKEKMQNKSFFNFDISYGNYAGNCTLIIRSNNENYDEQELKDMFIYCCLNEL